MYKDKQITYGAGSSSSSALARANSASESAPRARSDASVASRSARQVGAAVGADSSPIEESSAASDVYKRQAPAPARAAPEIDLAPPPAPVPPAPPAPLAPPAAPSSVTDRLATLAHLRASGALTEAEFARAKALELGLPAP